MKRYAISRLLEWKNSMNRKPLLMYGARQVGKTWLIRDFAKNNYDKLIELNFLTNESLKHIFDNDISPEYIIQQLEIRFNAKIEPDKTLLFFDEIQESQRAMDSLKSFNEMANEYNIIAAGSFLGVTIGRKPVGQTDQITLYPMSFCEFLEAVEHDMLANAIKQCDTAAMAGASDVLETLLKQYFYVGGMPAAVLEFSKSGDLNKVLELQNELLVDYKGDFSKHVDVKNITKIRMLWDSIPMHLFKENKKFVYKNIKVGGRAAEFEEALQWLTDTGLVHKINKVEVPKIPLKMHCIEDFFKLYMLDIGLFCAKAEIKPEDIFAPKTDIVDGMNGALAEQFVLQELKFSGVSPLFYWGRDKGTSEIDFITQAGGEIIPIEVKSAKNTKSQSLKVYMQEFHPAKAIRVSLKNYGHEKNLHSIPLYMIGFALQTCLPGE
jgi:predicted AAA+ superfamily ATPase